MATVEVNTNGKKLTFDLGNLITILVLLATMAVAWGSLNQRVTQHDRDIDRLQTTMATVLEIARDNAATLRATNVAIDKNAEAINSLRTGWNNYVASSNSETTEIKESLAAIRAQLDAMAKQIDKLSEK